MKASEALLRAIAAEGGTIDATQLDEWVGKLIAAGFVKKAPNFRYTLTDSAVIWLKGKGVELPK